MLEKYLLKKNLTYFFNEKKIISVDCCLPKILKLYVEDWGYIVYLDISKVTDYNSILIHKNYLLNALRCKDINFVLNFKGVLVLEIYKNDFVNLDFKKIQLDPTQLLIGYDYKKEPIYSDMKKTPHLAIQGLSNTGKSKMVEMMLLNSSNNIKYYVLNSFNHDYVNLKCKKINDLNEIEKFLTDVLDNKIIQRKPTYIVIDEINNLTRNKKINTLISHLLEQSRHYNIFLVAIGQVLLKENISYKQLFNSRCSFKALDNSIYTSFLNVKSEFIDTLENREFYLLNECFTRGKTYFLNS